MFRRRTPRVLYAALLASCLAAGSSRVAAEDEAPRVLDADLAAEAAREGAGHVDVWVIFGSQPAARIAERLRGGYAERIGLARLPALTALARIEPMLPDREERARRGVGGVMELEKALLTAGEIVTLRTAREETQRLAFEMRTRVLDEARPLCDVVQSPVAAWIGALPGGEVRTRTVVLDALIARLPAAALPELARMFPSIVRVARAGVRSVELDTSVGAVGASSFTANGYAGGGASVAVLDTGIDASHPAFTTSSNAAVVTASTIQLSAASTASNFNDDASSADDFHSHGTHCAGIVASNDATYQGVAPGTSVLNAKCFFLTSSGGGSAFDSDIVAAADWAITTGADALSCSFGSGGTSDASDPLSVFFDAVVEVSGVSVALAAGNSGSAIYVPGDGFNCITVGGFDDAGSATGVDDVLATYSGRGPTADGRLKPELCAPGSSVGSASAHWEGSNPDFVNKSGTSMATPHVAGALALLLSYNANWQPDALKALLTNSARNVSPVSTSPDGNWGFGALDLARAYTDRTNTATASFAPTGPSRHFYTLGTLAAGARSTLAWNRAATFYLGLPGNGADTAEALVDLDLYLYNGSDGTQSAASASTVDDVEQVPASSALATAVLRVLRAGTFPTGMTSQPYALASAGSPVLVAPPDLAITSTSTSDPGVAGSTEFTFSATVTNQGGLRAPSPALTLTLPSGFTFTGTSTPVRSVTSLDPAATGGVAQTASWTVRSGTAGGTFSLSVAAASTGYGETFASLSASRSIVVDTTPPTANAGADVSVFATSAGGRTIALSGSASTDDNAALGLTYAWDTDGDGNFADAGGSASGVSPSVAFALGTRTVTLRVTDSVGNAATDSLIVEVKDNAPVAHAGADRTANEGSSIAFDGAGSTDVEGAVATWSWTFGDGDAATGAQQTHAFRDEGTYTVTLTVTDSSGQIATDTASVTVSNVAPSANAGLALSGSEGSAVTFVGSASDPGPSDVLTYAWSFGDGSSGAGTSPSHVYAQDGTYTATLSVADGDGGSGSSTVQVIVANVAPVALPGGGTASSEGAAVAFAGAATDAGSRDVLTYSWAFGDGATAPAATASHVYDQDGVYSATLTVTDDADGSASASRTITVANVAPDLVLPGPLDVDVGADLQFVLAPTDPSAADTAALAVVWRIVDAADATIVEGTGRDVLWSADRKFDGTLIVGVSDDEASVERRAPVHALSPPIGDTLQPVLGLGLAAAAERRALLGVIAAQSLAAHPRELKSAAKRLETVSALLARHSVTTGGVVARLRVLAADFRAGVAPVAEPVFVPPVDPGTIEELIGAAPRAGTPGKARTKLLHALVDLRRAQRSGPAKRAALTRRMAARAAARLPDGSARDWFVASILAL